MSGSAQPAGGAPATAAEIATILGPTDETLVVEIQRTGATAAEVLEAFMRLEQDEAVGPELRRPPSPRVTAVMALLDAAKPGPDRD